MYCVSKLPCSGLFGLWSISWSCVLYNVVKGRACDLIWFLTKFYVLLVFCFTVLFGTRVMWDRGGLGFVMRFWWNLRKNCQIWGRIVELEIGYDHESQSRSLLHRLWFNSWGFKTKSKQIAYQKFHDHSLPS